MPNIVLRRHPHASSFRRIAAAAWDDMYQATILGQLKVRAEPLEAYVEALRASSGVHVTLTHCVTRALAVLLARHPDLNALVRHREIYLRQDIDIFVQVALPSDDPSRLGKSDLSGIVVRRADRLDVVALAEHIRDKAAKLRRGQDPEFSRTKRSADRVPGWVMRPFLKLVQLLQYGFNVNTRLLGAPRDPFGSAMVTSVGMFGAPVGFAPFFPLARTPIVLCIGAVLDEPVLEDGAVVPGRVVNIQATLDHRVIDGYHAGVLSRELSTILAEPEVHLGAPEPVSAAGPPAG